jgi:hypothetical protein
MFEANIILNFLIMKKKKLTGILFLEKSRISSIGGTKILGGGGVTSSHRGLPTSLTLPTGGECGPAPTHHDGGTVCACE